ncbi:MAG: TIGR02186 family protein [Hyphomonadaceae bacterium]
MIRRLAILGLAVAAAGVALAQQRAPGDRPFMPAGLAEDSIQVTVNFTGSRAVLFANTPQPENETSGLAVALIGPSIRQKLIRRTPKGEEVIEFVSAPNVFAVGAEPQVAATVERDTLARVGLDPASAAQPTADKLTEPDLPAWREAFVDLKQQEGLYVFDAAEIHRFDGGLHRATISLPINAPPGEYRVRAVAFRNGEPVGETDQMLTLERSGLEETLFDLSRQHGLVYGFVAVLLGAVVGGIGAWFGRK